MYYLAHIPIEIKIMVCLRILGRNCVCDDIYELSGVKESTSQYIFKKFVEGFTKHLFPLYVKFPEGEKLVKTMQVFARLGFPGAFGSMDITHLKWLMCPVEDKQLHTGKEPYPTLAFQVIVDHARLINYCSSYFSGGNNDKNNSPMLIVLEMLSMV